MPAMAGPSTRTGRRPESVEARNRGVLGANLAGLYQSEGKFALAEPLYSPSRRRLLFPIIQASPARAFLWAFIRGSG